MVNLTALSFSSVATAANPGFPFSSFLNPLLAACAYKLDSVHNHRLTRGPEEWLWHSVYLVEASVSAISKEGLKVPWNVFYLRLILGSKDSEQGWNVHILIYIARHGCLPPLDQIVFWRSI